MRRMSKLSSLAFITVTVAASVGHADGTDTQPATQPAPASQPVQPPIEAPPASAPVTSTAAEPPKEKEKKKKKNHAAEFEPEGPSAPEPEMMKGAVEYNPGKGIDVKEGKASVRFRLIIQPLFRYGTNSNGSFVDSTGATQTIDDTVDALIRRARFGMHAKLPHGVGLKFEVQVKNTRWGLSNMYGSWSKSDAFELDAGFFKPPGGLERDTFSFDMPFAERGIVSNFTKDRELGVKAQGTLDDLLYAVAVTRDGPADADEGDPEDLPQAPAGVDLADLQRGAGNWNFAGRFGWVPSNAFEVSVNGGAKVRPDGDLGERIAEPDDTTVSPGHAWEGVLVHAGADMALSVPHFRAMLEGAVKREGSATETGASGNLTAEAAYLVLGWSPSGRYAAAVKNAPLRKSWELVTRLEGVHVDPPSNTTGPIDWFGATLAWNMIVSKQLRVEANVVFQDYSKNAPAENSNAKRVYAELFATFSL
jgi:hypothetical protein